MAATTVTMAPGETHTVRLPARDGAGYSWSFAVTGQEACVSVTRRKADGPPPPPPGAVAGSYSLDDLVLIEAIRPGRASVHLTQRRSWEPHKPPLAEETIDVRVEGGP